MKKRGLIALLVLVLGIGMIAYSAPRLLEARQIFDEGDTAYRALRNEVVISSASGLETHPETASEAQALLQRVDFKTLRAINEDAVAWLYSPGTMIDYPVVRAHEYNYYLFHLLDHSYNGNGTLFIDYNNAPDFSERLTVIYGHHMDTEMMFTSLMGYKNQDYYGEHPCMYLYTETDIYRVDLIYGCVIGAGEWRSRAFMFEANLDELLAYSAAHSTFVSNVSYKEGDRVVAMSTCSFEFDDARYVVLGILRRIEN